MSGGASANWIAPVHGVSFADKQAVTRALLRSGANIGEINTVRKHLSRIKGGRLAHHAAPARVVTIAISDVPGDDPAVIGSGPTVPDPSTLAEPLVVASSLELPASVTRALDDPTTVAETRRPGFAGDIRAAARPADACARRKRQSLPPASVHLGAASRARRAVAAAHASSPRAARAPAQ